MSGNLGKTNPEPIVEDSNDDDDTQEFNADEPLEQFNVASPEQTVSSIASTSTYNTGLVRKRKSKLDVGNALLQIEKEKLQFLQEKKQKLPEDDEDMCFFKSLLPHVKHLTPEQKLDYRMKVMKITQDAIKPTTFTQVSGSWQYNAPSTEACTQQQATARLYYNSAGTNILLTEQGKTILDL